MCEAPEPEQTTLYTEIFPSISAVRGGDQEMLRVVGLWTVISAFRGHPVTTEFSEKKYTCQYTFQSSNLHRTPVHENGNKLLR